MDVNSWKRRNNVKRMLNRARHPWPLYRRVGGINAVVNRADGTVEDLGRISETYAKRWGVGTGGGTKAERKADAKAAAKRRAEVAEERTR